LFLRYLLHELPPDGRAKVDEALIVDQEFSDAFQEARYDLIDAYVANELPAEDRQRVEKAIFSSENGQKALSMARAMHKEKTMAERKDAAPLSVSAVSRARVPTTNRTFRTAFLASTLAACLLLLFAVIHVHRVAIHRIAQAPSRPSSTTTASTGPEKPGAAQSSTLPQNAVSKPHSASGKNSVLAVAIMGTVRGADAIPVQIHRGIQRVQVQWAVPYGSTDSTYTLEVVSGQASIAVIQQHGPLDTVGNMRVANFFLPADKFPSGQYIFRFRAADASGNTPVVESSVRISR
jgi:anti-sigma factor RsiW